MNKLYIGLLIIGSAIMGSCTKYDNPAPFFEDYELEEEQATKKKLLIINIDGLVGEQLKAYTPQTMTKMLANSKYTFRAQSDINSSDPSSLVTLITGKPSSSHGVKTDTYMPAFDNSDPHAPTSFVPSIIYRLEQKEKSLNTAAFMRNSLFTGAYLTDADQFVVENTDAQVKTRAVDFINTNIADLVIVQFSEALEAGKSGGFAVSNVNYKSAIDKIDGYVGELLAAIDKRKDAEYENWLVVICSSHGGTLSGSYGGSTTQETSTFSMYYNKKFKGVELIGDDMTSFYANGYFVGSYPYYDATGKTRNITEDGPRAISPSGAASNIFNASTAGEISYEFKIKLRQETFWANTTFSGGYRNYYNFIMGKDDADGTSAGWHIYGQDMSFSLRVQDGSKTESFNFGRGMDGAWNHYTVTFKAEGTLKTKGAVYVNGELAGSMIFNTPISSFSNGHPLTFGYATQGYKNLAFLNADFADVRVWNKELTKEQVARVACQKWIDESDPLRKNLIAYYHSFEGDTKWKNSITDKGAPDLTITNHTEILTQTNVRPACGIIPEYVFLQNIDLAPQVFYWLGVEMDEEWALPGNLFLNNFENEFNQ